MVNYSNGKIYKIEPIVEHEEGEIYVGSTTKQYLSQRMDKHRNSYKRWKDGKAHKFTVYDLFDNDNLDKIKHYRENNRDKMKNYLVQYRKDNKDKIQAICICNICNCNYTKQNKKQHQKSQKHQDNLNNQN